MSFKYKNNSYSQVFKELEHCMYLLGKMKSWKGSPVGSEKNQNCKLKKNIIITMKNIWLNVSDYETMISN